MRVVQLNALVTYINRQSHPTDPCPGFPSCYSTRSYRIVGAHRSLAGPQASGPEKTRPLEAEDARRQTRVRFIPDDVHVVVIIIIAFCIITIISAATSVIYSRSRVCIMRAGVLRLRALITTLPVYSSVYPRQRLHRPIVIAAVEGRRSRHRARNALRKLHTGSIAAYRNVNLSLSLSHEFIDAIDLRSHVSSMKSEYREDIYRCMTFDVYA